MIYKLLNFLLNTINKRPSLILINAITFMFSFYCLKSLLGFLHGYTSDVDPELHEQMNDTLNGIAGVLVALGVLLESRIIIQQMTKITLQLHDGHLNEVAEHNGLGLLLIGLFMEIITFLIDIPSSIFDSSGLEIYLFYTCFGFIALSMIVELDFIKDYIKSYFPLNTPKQYKEKPQLYGQKADKYGKIMLP